MNNRLTYNELRNLATEFVKIISSNGWKGKAVKRFKNMELVLWLFIDWLWDKYEIRRKEIKYSKKD
jgi:hypothetical protein